MTLELDVDEGLLMRVGQAMTKLQAEAFIQPELPGYTKDVLSVASVYPSSAPPPNHYRRTGRLQGGWRQTLANLQAGIRNEVPYSGFVGGLDASPGGRYIGKRSRGGANQPYTWRYGWPRLKKVMMDRMDRWIAEMESKAFRLWERT